MSRRRNAGFSMLEMVVAIAIFGALLLILVATESELLRFERTQTIDMLRHPSVSAVLARLRRDVLDSSGYPSSFQSYSQSSSTLLLNGADDLGNPVTIVYDFSEDGVARRMVYLGTARTSLWIARNVPKFEIGSFDMPDGSVAVRAQAKEKGVLAFDAIMQPRVD